MLFDDLINENLKSNKKAKEKEKKKIKEKGEQLKQKFENLKNQTSELKGEDLGRFLIDNFIYIEFFKRRNIKIDHITYNEINELAKSLIDKEKIYYGLSLKKRNFVKSLYDKHDLIVNKIQYLLISLVSTVQESSYSKYTTYLRTVIPNRFMDIDRYVDLYNKHINSLGEYISFKDVFKNIFIHKTEIASEIFKNTELLPTLPIIENNKKIGISYFMNEVIELLTKPYYESIVKNSNLNVYVDSGDFPTSLFEDLEFTNNNIDLEKFYNDIDKYEEYYPPFCDLARNIYFYMDHIKENYLKNYQPYFISKYPNINYFIYNYIKACGINDEDVKVIDNELYFKAITIFEKNLFNFKNLFIKDKNSHYNIKVLPYDSELTGNLTKDENGLYRVDIIPINLPLLMEHNEKNYTNLNMLIDNIKDLMDQTKKYHFIIYLMYRLSIIFKFPINENLLKIDFKTLYISTKKKLFMLIDEYEFRGMTQAERKGIDKLVELYNNITIRSFIPSEEEINKIDNKLKIYLSSKDIILNYDNLLNIFDLIIEILEDHEDHE